MAIKIKPGSILYTPDFGGASAPNYRATAGESGTFVFDLFESVYFKSSNLEPITSDAVLISQNKLQFPSYESLNGFEAGQNVVLTRTGGSNLPATPLSTTIQNIDYNTNIVQFAALFTPVNRNLNNYDSSNIIEVWATSTREDLYIDLNFTKSTLPNRFDTVFSTLPGNYATNSAAYRKSPVDGNFTRFYGANTGSIAVGADVDLVQQGYSSGSFATSVNVERLGDINTYTRQWRVTMQVIQIGALISDLFNTDTSQFAKFYFDVEWYSGTSGLDPTVVGWNLGNSNTAWFNQPVNGGTFNSTAPGFITNQLYYNQEVTNTIQITSASADISLGANFVPVEDAYYKNQNNNQSTLCMLIKQNAALAVGIYTSTANPDGAQFIIEITALTYSAGVHTVTFKFRPANSAFTDFMEARSDRFMQIWLKVGDVPWLIYDTELEAAPKPTIPLTWFHPTPGNYTLFRTDKTSVIYQADDLTEQARASTDDNLIYELTLIIPNGSVLNSAKFEIVAAEISTFDAGTGTFTNEFTLQSMNFDFTGQPVTTLGVLEANMSQSIGENMPATSGDFRAALVTRDRARLVPVPGFYEILFLYPLFINWRQWLPQLNAPIDYFPLAADRTKNWINYQNGTFQLYAKLTIDCADANRVKYGGIGHVYDYDQIFTSADEEWQGTSSVELTVVSSGQVVPCFIIGEMMHVKMTFNKVQPGSLSTIWGQLTIEPLENSPRWVISSNYAHDFNQNSPFMPLTGETRLKRTVTGDVVEFECLVDTSKLSGENQVLKGKYYNNSAAPLEQVRSKYDLKLLAFPFPTTESEIENARDNDECCDVFQVFGSTTSEDIHRNDFEPIYQKLIDAGDTVEFKMYKDGVLTAYQPTLQTFPNQSDARFSIVSWRDVLDSDGNGCYEIKVVYTGSLTQTFTWAKFELQEYSYHRAKGFTRIRGVFNSQQQAQGIDFTGSGIYGTLRLPGGFFGNMQPKTKINNFVLATGVNTKTTRENLKEYELNANYLSKMYTRRLIDFFLLSENEMYITDESYNNHEIYVEKPVIVSESPEIEYIPGSRLARVSCKFTDKVFDQRSFY